MKEAAFLDLELLGRRDDVGLLFLFAFDKDPVDMYCERR